jgi:predicted DCC family thiol-disulfide oxidoreductase YuxK
VALKQTPRHLVLWDGDCGFCRRAMQWLLKHDRYGRLVAVPNQEAAISPELRAQCQKAVHVIKDDGSILRAGRAMLFCLEQTRWHRLARIGGWPIFIPFIEMGYALVARNRALLSKFLFTKETNLEQN